MRVAVDGRRATIAGLLGMIALAAACGCVSSSTETRKVQQASQWQLRVPTHWDLWMASPPHIWAGVTDLPTDFLDRQIQLASSNESTTFFLALLHGPDGVDIESEAQLQLREQERGGPAGSMEIDAPPEVSREGDRWTVEFHARGPHPIPPREEALDDGAAADDEWDWRFMSVQSPDRPQEAWMLVCATSTPDAREDCDAAIESFIPWEWPVIP